MEVDMGAVGEQLRIFQNQYEEKSREYDHLCEEFNQTSQVQKHHKHKPARTNLREKTGHRINDLYWHWPLESSRDILALLLRNIHIVHFMGSSINVVKTKYHFLSLSGNSYNKDVNNSGFMVSDSNYDLGQRM